MAAEPGNRRTYTAGVYYGNTAPAVREVPEKTEREIRRERKRYIASSQKKVEEKVRAGRRNVASFTFPQVVVLAAAVITFAAMSLMYLNQLSRNRELKALADSYATAYQELAESNALLENEANARIDYDAIYQYATETLGMQIPEKQQVVRYESKSSEHVEKGGAIPNE